MTCKNSHGTVSALSIVMQYHRVVCCIMVVLLHS